MGYLRARCGVEAPRGDGRDGEGHPPRKSNHLRTRAGAAGMALGDAVAGGLVAAGPPGGDGKGGSCWRFIGKRGGGWKHRLAANGEPPNASALSVCILFFVVI